MIAALALVAVAPWALEAWTGRRRRAALARATPSRREPEAAELVDPTVVLELVGAALRAGAGIPRALAAVADAVGGVDGAVLAPVAAALRLGAPWTAAWADAPSRLDVVARALRPTWEEGAAPGEALSAAGDELLRARRDAGRTAAGRLGVRLVLPLGTCFLPAFVLVGLAPVLLALGSGVLAG
ncbi:type II secretion system F family protein [Xylanimonas protaetiae]|uniref:Secretion system protein n=1 Tax=Xylanimonas protaetiae TaxID=2509457 RepID=A0A4P6F698_9MICO|nr:type II secretion system F family protein [Xylanimonas protaetiae]QAY69829.1 secretion system protein [Xylanimonas protaetiae]